MAALTNYHKLGGFKQQKLFTVLEARSPKSRCQQGHSPSKGPKGWSPLAASGFRWLLLLCLVASDSLRPAGLLCPWDSPGKNTGVGSHLRLQGIFLTRELNPSPLHWQADFLPLSHQGITDLHWCSALNVTNAYFFCFSRISACNI